MTVVAQPLSFLKARVAIRCKNGHSKLFFLGSSSLGLVFLATFSTNQDFFGQIMKVQAY